MRRDGERILFEGDEPEVMGVESIDSADALRLALVTLETARNSVDLADATAGSQDMRVQRMSEWHRRHARQAARVGRDLLHMSGAVATDQERLLLNRLLPPWKAMPEQEA